MPQYPETLPLGLAYVTPPAAEPLSVAEVKPWLRLPEDDTSQDGIVSRLIASARVRYERASLRACLAQTLRLSLPDWPAGGEIRLPRPPLRSVVSVTYLDPGGARQTVDPAAYVSSADEEPARLVPVSYWPAALTRPGSVQVTYQAGLTAPADVPEDVKERLLVCISHHYHNRERPDEEYLDALFDAFRTPW